MTPPRTRSLAARLGLTAACCGLAAGLHAAPSAPTSVRVVDARGLPIADAVVTIHPVAGPARGVPTFPWRNAMAQKQLTFTPGTLIVAKGAKVAFPNLDTVRHSVYSFSKAAKFEIELYGRDQTRTQTFPIVGTVALGCNIHDAMRGYIKVVDTPFAAKTDRNGQVSIAGIPNGRATLTVWHPKARAPANEVSQLLSGPGGNTRITMTLRP